MGAKYRELGNRGVIHVGMDGPDYKNLRYGIYRGAGLFDRQVGEKNLKEMSWNTEAEAQTYLDHIARVHGWKKV